jgi:hypothetical protein
MSSCNFAETQTALEGFRARAYRLWLDCLCDEQPADAIEDTFSFAETDDAAPHNPLVILNDPRFEQFNPLNDLSEVGEAAIRSTFGAFTTALADRVLDNSASEVHNDAD